ncbi:hypothetical protein [Streptomyces venezuelae]|uniref:hypothetical protein n=1 Tax=Streptomyces venezuelae TaxID=54571 RepID=UPI00123B5E2B|nr:hypothetical protein [Streptomyces venezuelae]QES08045.1 hypothetical protein DEJ44_22115 [Streptomyces venezuelae]QES13288.1 hypothetical protein DEJ45_13325 [Streptomyces venezuelae]
MSRYEDEEAAVRELLDGPHPPVPGDLGRRAAEHGARLLHRARRVRRVLWFLGAVAVVAFVVWASAARPWQVPPAATTPPFDGL